MNWRIVVKTADNGCEQLVVEPYEGSTLGWHVTDWPDAESRQIASDLCDALNALDAYRTRVYGLPAREMDDWA